MSIQLNDVHFAYQSKMPEVFSGITLTIPDGQMVALVGPSGSGKTTLLQLIGGILKPTQGSVTVDVPADRKRWVFQNPTLLARQSVRENIDIAVHGEEWSADDASARVAEMIKDVGLTGMENKPVNQLSGGQQQRVQIARALASKPPLVLADEPTGQLDHTTTGLVLDAIRAALDQGTTVVIVTHDQYVAAQCECIVTLEDGGIKDDTGEEADHGQA